MPPHHHLSELFLNTEKDNSNLSRGIQIRPARYQEHDEKNTDNGPSIAVNQCQPGHCLNSWGNDIDRSYQMIHIGHGNNALCVFAFLLSCTSIMYSD